MSADIVLTRKQNTIQGERYFEKLVCCDLYIFEGKDLLSLESFDIIAETRTADELVKMIAHFYYNAKKPSCINDAALSPQV